MYEILVRFVCGGMLVPFIKNILEFFWDVFYTAFLCEKCVQWLVHTSRSICYSFAFMLSYTSVLLTMFWRGVAHWMNLNVPERPFVWRKSYTTHTSDEWCNVHWDVFRNISHMTPIELLLAWGEGRTMVRFHPRRPKHRFYVRKLQFWSFFFCLLWVMCEIHRWCARNTISQKVIPITLFKSFVMPTYLWYTTSIRG